MKMLIFIPEVKTGLTWLTCFQPVRVRKVSAVIIPTFPGRIWSNGMIPVYKDSYQTLRQLKNFLFFKHFDSQMFLVSNLLYLDLSVCKHK